MFFDEILQDQKRNAEGAKKAKRLQRFNRSQRTGVQSGRLFSKI